MLREATKLNITDLPRDGVTQTWGTELIGSAFKGPHTKGEQRDCWA